MYQCLLQVMQILLAKSMFMLEMWGTYAQNVRGFWIRQQYLLQTQQLQQLQQSIHLIHLIQV